ncbi:MAG: protein kinase [Bryobacteraceae bacterium]
MLGTKLSHFEIIGRIGEGGMGVVYLARDLNLGRQVAIKLLPDGQTKDPDALRRFLAEAKAASALNHPNIVTVYEVSNDGEHWFIAMEHIQGKTLTELIPADGLPLAQALKYASQAADALAAAHAAGVIHRDVKPGNIMITDTGLLKVLDFGLAKLVPQAGPQDQTVRAEQATVPGTILGTFDYMSPEQAEGKEAGARSDIFSFGVVLYEMLTGRKAFHRESQAATLTALMRDDPQPPSQVRNGIPPELDVLISQCVRKQPDRRIDTMRAVHEALEQMRQPSQSSAIPTSHKTSSHWKAIAALAVFIAAGASTALYFRSPKEEAPRVFHPLPLTNYPGTEIFPTFSPDGKQVAFSWNGEKRDNSDIYVKYLDSQTPLRLTHGPESDLQPSWSPDGRWIAFLRRKGTNYSLHLISPHGTEERKLVEGPETLQPITWLPDGKSLTFSRRRDDDSPYRIFRFALDSGKTFPLTDPPQGELGDRDRAFSNDGKAMLFVRRGNNVAVSKMMLLDLTPEGDPAGQPLAVLSGASNLSHPQWLPGPGNRILFLANVSPITFAWESRLSGSGAQRTLEQPTRLDALQGARTIALSRTGPPFLLAYDVFSLNLNIRAISLPDGKMLPEPISSTSFIEESPSYSPDGKQLAFRSSRDGDLNIWICASDGTSARQLTHRRNEGIGGMAWSPDSKWILVSFSGGADHDIYRVNVASGAMEKILGSKFSENHPRWSPDGRWIYYSSDQTGQLEIWRMPAAGGTSQQITTTGGAYLKFSPDGKWIFYRQKAGETGNLWRMPSDGGPSQKVAENVAWSNWAVVSNGLYYADVRSLWFVPESGKSAREVAKFPARLGAGMDIHPDGKTLLIPFFEGNTGSELMYIPDFR